MWGPRFRAATAVMLSGPPRRLASRMSPAQSRDRLATTAESAAQDGSGTGPYSPSLQSSSASRAVQLDFEGVRPDGRLVAERAGDHAPERRSLDVVLAHAAGGPLLRHPGVIPGHLEEPAAADDISPAVADVGDEGVAGADQGGDEGRAHAGGVGNAGRQAEDLGVGLADGLEQGFAGRDGALLREGLGQNPDRRGRGLGASDVAADAVGHGQKPLELGPRGPAGELQDEEAVLVVLALAPDVAPAEGFYPHFNRHHPLLALTHANRNSLGLSILGTPPPVDTHRGLAQNPGHGREE